MKYAFIEQARVNFPVCRLWEVLQIAPSGYDAWRKRKPRPRAQANTELGAHIRLSMSSPDNCYDNASAESVLATIKLEAIQARVFDTHQQAKLILFDFIEVFYNRQRLHSGIHFQCPAS